MIRIVRSILTIAFGWSFLKNLDLLARPESLDRALFDAVGLTGLFFVLLIGLMACQAASVLWFWTRYAYGYLFAFGAIVLGLIEASIGCAVMLQQPEVARAAMIASRKSRGLSVNQQTLDLMANPALQIAPLIVLGVLALLWCGLIILLIRDNRPKPAEED